MPGTVLGPEERAVNKTDKIPCPHEAADIPVEWPSPTRGGANPALGPGLAGAGLSRKEWCPGGREIRLGGTSGGAKPETKRAWPRCQEHQHEVEGMELSERGTGMEKDVKVSNSVAADVINGHSTQMYWPDLNYSALTWFNFSAACSSYETREIPVTLLRDLVRAAFTKIKLLAFPANTVCSVYGNYEGACHRPRARHVQSVCALRLWPWMEGAPVLWLCISSTKHRPLLNELKGRWVKEWALAPVSLSCTLHKSSVFPSPLPRLRIPFHLLLRILSASIFIQPSLCFSLIIPVCVCVWRGRRGIEIRKLHLSKSLNFSESRLLHL